MLFAGGRADIDHVVHDDQSGEMSAGSERKRTLFTRGQFGQVVADLKIVRGNGLLIVDDGREDRQSVDTAVFVWHG